MAKVLLAIPTSGGIHERTSTVAARLTIRPDVEYITAAGRPVDYVRNSLIRIFLKDASLTHLFLLDSDIEPPLDCLKKLLALDVPLAGGCYPVIMQKGLRWALANADNDRRYRLLERLPFLTEPFDVDAGGAGCLLIRRDVFDKIKWPWFKWIEHEDGIQESEDIHFFRKCNEAGLKVMIDPQVICNHFKITNITALMRMKMQGQKKGN